LKSNSFSGGRGELKAFSMCVCVCVCTPLRARIN
jgi:hypothetical protein